MYKMWSFWYKSNYLGMYFDNCKEGTLSSMANNEEMAKNLWDISADIVQLDIWIKVYLSTADSHNSISLIFQKQEIWEKVLETHDLNFESHIFDIWWKLRYQRDHQRDQEIGTYNGRLAWFWEAERFWFQTDRHYFILELLLWLIIKFLVLKFKIKAVS